jgi:DMSO reductase family type II enzyme heme b subunit
MKGSTMHVKKVSADLGDPTGAGWSEVGAETVSLTPMPIDAQPTEYVRVKWADLPYGNVSEATVAAAHDGSTAWVRLEWADSDEPNVEFPDAAAVYFPSGDDAPAATIGSEDAGVNLWFWRSDEEKGRHLSGTGPGRFHPKEGSVATTASLEGGRWAVVLSHPLDELRDGAALGVAVWDGSNEERAGIGAATTEWLSLSIDS